MKNKTAGSILKKAAEIENESYLLYKNTANTVQSKFAEEELNHVEIFNILYMFRLENKK